ncbi:ABC transporter ATP-binding protein [Levilactobacillus spicheri]|uniref:ABC transporter ATP-binding protein n=2 Tax=Levilactobacillus spicheri TaxID=216463 RepID=A0ABQ0WQ91_9LACO|nr:ABC transporter ATP-binding protein [Levilactobacillus spicheri]KRL47437.1 ABC superfamily ATP binding cassette transporter ABC protein [Levilactobacillus spicheri DSM 15429]GEO67243.1 ABC transporter ATP-binding protein [Levilactobacillus spicheri]
MTNAIEITDLTYRKNYKTILADVNLTIATGRVVGLLGENGAGKTTLMRLLADLAKGNHGNIAVAGATRGPQRRANLSFTEHLQGFRPGMKLREVADFYAAVYPDFAAQKYLDLITFLQLDDDLALNQLSRGMREKFIIALTLARQARVYLLDEPFAGIDSMSRKRIIGSIIRWKQPEATMLISDHYVTEIAPLLDEVVVVKDQTVVAHKSSEAIRQDFGIGVEAFYEGIYEGEIHDDEL